MRSCSKLHNPAPPAGIELSAAARRVVASSHTSFLPISYTGSTVSRRSSMLVLVAAVLLAVAASGLPAAPAEDFYRGKTLTLFAGQPPGGGIDGEMRLVARFLGKFIPGEPSILPMNMQGAGGIILGKHLYSVAKPDGLTLGMPGRTGFALAPVISAADTKYDLRKFTWIGSSASSNFGLFM